MKKIMYGCTLIIIGTMFLLSDIILYLPTYIIGIMLLIIDRMFENNNSKEVEDNNYEDSLIHLRDIEVLSNEELEGAIKLFSEQYLEDKEVRKYYKYLKVLNQLKGKGYLTDSILKEKIMHLKNYYNID